MVYQKRNCRGHPRCEIWPRHANALKQIYTERIRKAEIAAFGISEETKKKLFWHTKDEKNMKMVQMI
jgi:glycerol kinase